MPEYEYIEQREYYERCLTMFERTRAAHEATTPDEWLLAWFEHNLHGRVYVSNHIRPMIVDLDLPTMEDWSRSVSWYADDDTILFVYDTDGNEVK